MIKKLLLVAFSIFIGYTAVYILIDILFAKVIDWRFNITLAALASIFQSIVYYILFIKYKQ